jgi:predicted nucleotidyltransferase
MADAARLIVERRLSERDELIERARRYVAEMGARVNVVAAYVAGSVARGDFNVWSDIDVVIVATDLPTTFADRERLFTSVISAGVQAVFFTPEEFESERRRGNALIREAIALNVRAD